MWQLHLRSICYMAVASIIISGACVLAHISDSANSGYIEDGEVTEELLTESQPLHDPEQGMKLNECEPNHTAAPCCGSLAHLENQHFLIVATMDGVIRALDVNNAGATMWNANFDAQPLMSGTLGRIQPMTAENDEFHLVPALDGSLYMYSIRQQILEPIPLNTESLLQASLKIGHEAVAGGKTVTTTGVDPLTGKIRYHCDMAHCSKATTEDAEATLVFKRSGHSIRAIDALSGTERWNLSVAEYEAALPRKSRLNTKALHSSVSFKVSPPEGIITAQSICGQLFEVNVGNHVAHIWEMVHGEIREVSLFESRNIHTLAAEAEISRHSKLSSTGMESLFYLGTCNNMPFIIHSPHLKMESMRISSKSTRLHDSSQERQLLPAVRNSFMVQPMTLVDMITSSYKNSIAKELIEQRNRNERQIVRRKTGDVQVATAIASCPNNEGVALIGQSDIRSARLLTYDGPDNLDNGYFVMRSSTPRPSWMRRNAYDPQCGILPRLRRNLRLDESVSGLWRVFALLMTAGLGLVTGIYLKLRSRNAPLHEEIVNSPASHAPPTSSDISPPEELRRLTCSTTETPIPISSNATTSLPDSSDLSAPGPIRLHESSSSISDVPFASKFEQDFDVTHILGKGGYGVVFAARNKIDENEYAVKRIAVARDHAIDRVLREVRVMAKLDHPGIIRYFHSWMERPPPDWQEQNDKMLLKKMKELRAKNREISATQDSLSLPPAVGESRTASEVTSEISNDLSNTKYGNSNLENLTAGVHFDNIFPDDPDKSSGSWADDFEKSEIANTSSEDSDDEASSSSGFDIRDSTTALKEESDSIIFVESSKSKRRRQQSTKSISSQEVSKIEPPVILVTSKDNDLLTAKNNKTKCYAYIYIQMQLCEYHTLSDWLRKHDAPDDREIQRMKNWFTQLVKAVEYIHSRGLIHRDIKPQNIFFFADDHLKIGDMGLVSKNTLSDDDYSAGSSNEHIGHTGDVGTKTYMSPEQLAHKSYSSKVDVFSLGVVFVEMIIPFSTETERRITLYSLQKGKLPDALNATPEEKLFASLLCAKDPAKRPTCLEVLSNPYLQDSTKEIS